MKWGSSVLPSVIVADSSTFCLCSRAALRAFSITATSFSNPRSRILFKQTHTECTRHTRVKETTSVKRRGDTAPVCWPVSLIQDEPPDAAEADALGVVDVVDQAARGCNQDVDPLSQPVGNIQVQVTSCSEQRPCSKLLTWKWPLTLNTWNDPLCDRASRLLPGLLRFAFLPTHQDSRYNPGEWLWNERQADTMKIKLLK